MNPKAEQLFDAITHLREDLVEEAQNHVFRKKPSGWRTFGSLAACVALVASLGLLAAMPRGCGAAGSKNNDSSAPMAPAEAPGDENTGASGGAGYGDGLMGGSSVPEPSGEAPPTEAEQLRFWGQVLEILEDGLLVEPFDDFLAGLGPVYVSTAELDGLPEFYRGGTVRILCGTISQEDGKAIAEGVTAVDLVEAEQQDP